MLIRTVVDTGQPIAQVVVLDKVESWVGEKVVLKRIFERPGAPPIEKIVVVEK